MTRRSKHFMTSKVSATGLKSLRQVMADFLGTRMMVVAFRQAGTVARSREVLNILVRTPDKWSAQAFIPFPITLFGPAALWEFIAFSALFT